MPLYAVALARIAHLPELVGAVAIGASLHSVRDLRIWAGLNLTRWIGVFGNDLGHLPRVVQHRAGALIEVADPDVWLESQHLNAPLERALPAARAPAAQSLQPGFPRARTTPAMHSSLSERQRMVTLEAGFPHIGGNQRNPVMATFQMPHFGLVS